MQPQKCGASTGKSALAARLVRLDLLQPSSLQDGHPSIPSGLPWEHDSSCHAQGAYGTPSVVYLGKQPEVKFGRHPEWCSVVLDCPEVPQMISRVHARLVLAEGTWLVADEKSVNGVLVNGVPLQAPRFLRSGDVLCFGRHLPGRPVFEYLFEEGPEAETPGLPAARPVPAAGPAAAGGTAQEVEQRGAAAKRKRNGLDLEELQAELVCSICQDWIVHAASLECGHSFCHECIAEWLRLKRFHCPMCRSDVRREPTASRALDVIVSKGVDGGAEDSQAEFLRRVRDADQRSAKRLKDLTQLQESVHEALVKGKAFFHVESAWRKREKQVFEKGVKDYCGEAREVYCRLIGLTTSWIHSTDANKLNQALHNLGLAQEYVDKAENGIRQRLIMFLRYG